MTVRRARGRAISIDPRPIFAWLALALPGLIFLSAAAHGHNTVVVPK